MKFPPFLHSHLRLTLLGTPPNRVFLCENYWTNPISLFVRKKNPAVSLLIVFIINNSFIGPSGRSFWDGHQLEINSLFSDANTRERGFRQRGNWIEETNY